jgi:hypothetical protein
MIAGRISGDPMSIAGFGEASGDLVVVEVPDGAKSHSWAAIRAPDCHLDQPLVDGAAVAIVGTVDPDRRSPGRLRGPITIDAVLVLGPGGEFFRNT